MKKKVTRKIPNGQREEKKHPLSDKQLKKLLKAGEKCRQEALERLKPLTTITPEMMKTILD